MPGDDREWRGRLGGLLATTAERLLDVFSWVWEHAGFQNEGPARSPDVNDWADSSIITIEKRHDGSAEYWNRTGCRFGTR